MTQYLRKKYLLNTKLKRLLFEQMWITEVKLLNQHVLKKVSLLNQTQPKKNLKASKLR